jgi:hypothetical protein
MRFVLLGEQEAGKSSFLVALYGTLVNRRASEPRIVRTVDEVEFLSRGLEAFGRCESLRRTEIDSRSHLMIEVEHNGTVVGLEIPDRSGELLKHMIDARTWDPELHEQIGDAAGAMLFLRADQLLSAEEHDAALWPRPPGTQPLTAFSGSSGVAAGPPMALAEPDPSTLSWADLMTHDLTPEPRGSSEPSPWTPAQMPAEVRTVDLLQAVLEERSSPLPLVVLLSAWDRVALGGPPPGWLADRAPLLAQLLATHREQLPHAVFGVSAQGDDFEHDSAWPSGDKDPWDRAFVIGPEGVRGTLAEPLVWLLDAAM